MRSIPSSEALFFWRNSRNRFCSLAKSVCSFLEKGSKFTDPPPLAKNRELSHYLLSQRKGAMCHMLGFEHSRNQKRREPLRPLRTTDHSSDTWLSGDSCVE